MILCFIFAKNLSRNMESDSFLREEMDKLFDAFYFKSLFPYGLVRFL